MENATPTRAGTRRGCPACPLDRARAVEDAYRTGIATPPRRPGSSPAARAASRDSDFDALVAVLAPDVVLRADTGAGAPTEVRGAETVARQALAFSKLGLLVRPALVNGTAGWVATRGDESFSVGAFVVSGGRIAAIDILADPERLARLDPTVLA